MTAVFIHIPKTGGVSIQEALGLQQYRDRRALVKGTQYEGLVTFGHEILPSLIQRGYIPGDLFTFAFCRNPYDRAVSLWAHTRRDYEPGLTFPDYCRNLGRGAVNRRHCPQALWLDGIDIGFLGRFENLQEDFDLLCDVLGVDRRELPRLNESPHRDWRECYDTETAGIIRAHYARDFERFGYADNHLPD